MTNVQKFPYLLQIQHLKERKINFVKILFFQLPEIKVNYGNE